jgi:hypothetical protein
LSLRRSRTSAKSTPLQQSAQAVQRFFVVVSGTGKRAAQVPYPPANFKRGR